ncbi:MAG TPA: tripartite tricarboxylate transporter substrate-binding protein [Vicinamibacterales bacterium]
MAALVVLVAPLAGVGPAAAQTPYDHLRLIAPAAPGGGWDQTARVIQVVVQRTNIARTVSVENIPGAAGLIGLARFIGSERANGDALMVSGLIMLGAIVTQRSAVTLDDVTPIARLTGEYEVLTVPATSPFRTLDDFVRAFKERPEAISWGGGSAGGSDQILAGLIADAVGVAPRRVNYIAFSGGGESLSAILGGQVSVGVNGLAEFAPQIEAGTVRPLAISSAERLPGLDIPTLREQGIDVEFENWRSVVAPPGIDAADRRRLEAAVEAMVRSAEWKEALLRYRWIDRYLAGDGFVRFVDAEAARVQDILTRFGTRQETPSLTTAGPYPMIVLSGLALCGLATVLARGRTSSFPARERVAQGWRPIVLVASGILLDLVLAERAGFVVASAALFWFVARAFDPRHPLRDALFALAVSVGAYLLFGRVLDLQLPGGVFAGW